MIILVILLFRILPFSSNELSFGSGNNFTIDVVALEQLLRHLLDVRLDSPSIKSNPSIGITILEDVSRPISLLFRFSDTIVVNNPSLLIIDILRESGSTGTDESVLNTQIIFKAFKSLVYFY
jgi:hypothetical protein